MTIVGISLYTLLPFRAALGLIGLRNRHVAVIIRPPFLAALVLWIFVTIIRPYSSSMIPNTGALLALHIVTGGVLYLATLHLLSPQYFNDFRDILRRFSYFR